MDEQDKGDQSTEFEESEPEAMEKAGKKEAKSSEEVEIEEEPLEIGGFITPLKPPTISDPLPETPAQELAVGQAISYEGRTCEIISRTPILLQSGPIAARQQIRFELVVLFGFEGERLTPLVVRRTEKFRRVRFQRVRYTVLGLKGRDQENMLLQRQNHDLMRRIKSEFRVGRLGDDLAGFFGRFEENEDRESLSITLLVLEALGKYQVIGLGVGDWQSLG